MRNYNNWDEFFQPLMTIVMAVTKKHGRHSVYSVLYSGKDYDLYLYSGDRN